MDRLVDMELEARVRRSMEMLVSAMQTDGGGAEIVALKNGDLTVRLTGSCIFCPSRSLSAKALESGLRQQVPELQSVHVILIDERPEDSSYQDGAYVQIEP